MVPLWSGWGILVTTSLLAKRSTGAAPHHFLDTRLEKNATATAADRIKEGQDAAVGKFGYFVALLTGLRFSAEHWASSFVCGGSLLSPLFVLTAAHCVVDELGRLPLDLQNAHVGFFRHHVPNDDDTRRIRNVYVHPKYNGYLVRHDLAVVELEEAVWGYPSIVPDVGPQIPLRLGDWVTVIGLGDTGENDGLLLPEQLQEKQVHYMPTSLCGGWWMTIDRTTTSNKSLICTYADYFAGGTCRGDSGSPVIMNKDGRETVIGVASFVHDSQSCHKAHRILPDGHARVSAGRDVLWGPLVCNSDRVLRNDTSLRPSWCDHFDFATRRRRAPPDPVPRHSLLGFPDATRLGQPPRNPYLVGIQFRNTLIPSQKWECLGTLIHPFFVLTMAECVHPKFGNFFEMGTVRVGWNCLHDDNCSNEQEFQDRRSVQRIPHPQHGRNGGAWELYNVGLIRLDRPVSLDFVESFPKLDDGTAFPQALQDQKLRALGIGSTTPELVYETSLLHQFKTTLVTDNESCQRTVRHYLNKRHGNETTTRVIPDDLLACANRSGLSGRCSSPLRSTRDSLVQWGAPLLIPRSRPTADILVGTLNFRTTPKCSATASPDVYNRVSAYRPWIQCVICVGSIHATRAANRTADHLCSSPPPSPHDCQTRYGISMGTFDQ